MPSLSASSRNAVRFARSVALVVAVSTVAACGSSATLRVTDVESALVAGFADQVGGAFTATCPSPLPAEQGHTFTCTVTDVGEGTTVDVEVVEDDGDGAFRWHATSVTPQTP